MTDAEPLIEGMLWQFDLGMVSAYLLDDGTATLIDAGTPGKSDDLRAGLAAAGYAVEDVERVLVTHYDFDHVGGLAPLDLAVPVYAVEPDASYLDGTDRPPLTNKKGLLQRVTGPFLDPAPGDVTRLRDGDSIGGFTAYHTPGHTPGHAVFHHPGTETALLGDLVAEDGGELTTPPWPLAYDNDQVRRSIRGLADRDLGFEIACVGHGNPLRAGGAAALDRLAAR